jgi:uncharacterized protein YbjQ (UPF0145 family)
MDFELILFILLAFFGPFAFPVFSWAIGRWYQGTLLNALNEQEKQQNAAFGGHLVGSTSSKMTTLSAQSSVLLHTSIVVGPSMGQMFFMWIKSIFGGQLHSYDVVIQYGRREVIRRLQEQATHLGCSSIVNLRIETSTISFAKNQESKTSSMEFLAYATGIRN